jgi:hypothetical protein
MKNKAILLLWMLAFSRPLIGEETWRMAGIAIDVNHRPNTASIVLSEVVNLPNGGYRLYYSARRFQSPPGSLQTIGEVNIEYAESTDGNTWTFGGVALSSRPDPADPEFEINGPSIVKLPDGRWRMYYCGTPQVRNTGPHFQLFSAISDDGGKTFTREGLRIPDQFFDPSADLWQAAHGRIIKLKERGYVAILSTSTRTGGHMHNGVSLLTSDDGLKFSFSKDLYPEAHDPFVIQMGDLYRLYAIETSLGQPQVIKDAALMDTSTDGLTWNENKSSAVFLDQDGTRLVFAEGPAGRIGDFSGVFMNGKLRLFSNYRKADERGSTRIAFYDLVDQKDVPASTSSGTDIPSPAQPAGLVGLLQSLINPGNGTPENQAPQSSIDINSGLILHYDFDAEPVGGKVLDKSGHGNDGQAVGVQWVADGHLGGSALFGPTDGYIRVPNNDSLNPSNLTLAAWIKTSNQGDTWRRIFDKSFTNGYALSIGGGHTPGNKSQNRAIVEIGAREAHNKGGGGSDEPVTDGQWHHLAVTYNGEELHLYVDGWPQQRVARWEGRIPANSYDLTLGMNRVNPNPKFNEVGASLDGLMDDAMIFDRALSDDEVRALFKSQGGVLGPKPAPPQPQPTGTPAKPSAADRLKQLKDLLDQGLINQDQYDQKKKEIIDSM